MNKIKKVLIYLVLILILVLIDQYSKTYMYNISNGEIGYSIAPFNNYLIGYKYLLFTYVENHGGIFGTFQGHINIFTIVSTILILYIVLTEYKNFFKYNTYIQIGICFIIAGAIGNMYDRFFRGYVIDMINFHYIWQFVFNIADMYIHIGIYIIVIQYIFFKYIRVDKKGKK